MKSITTTNSALYYNHQNHGTQSCLRHPLARHSVLLGMAHRCSMLWGTSAIEVVCYLFTNRLRRCAGARRTSAGAAGRSPAIGPNTLFLPPYLPPFLPPVLTYICSLIAVLVAFLSRCGWSFKYVSPCHLLDRVFHNFPLNEICSLHSHKAFRRMFPLRQGHK